MSIFLRSIAVLVVLFPGATVVYAGAVEEPTLLIRGDAGKPLTIDRALLAKLPRQKATVRDHEGNDVSYEGVELHEILELAEIPLGEAVRGEMLAAYLLVEAADGYRVVFSLPEVDPSFNAAKILLVDQREGKPLNNQEGPFRIVIPGEKRQSRWIRQITTLGVRKIPRTKLPADEKKP